MNLNKNIDLLLADYFQLTAKKTDRWLSLQRSDIFQDANGNYTATFLAPKGPQIMLVDRFCNEVYSADQIIPLFDQEQDPTVLETIRTFYKNCPSDTVMSEQMIKALQAMSELSYPTSALAPAYLVRQGEHWGVVEPNGNILIEPKYAQIKLLGVEETFRYFSDLNEEFGRTISDAVMYICTEDFAERNSVDVYNLAGELVFHGIQTIRPHEQKLITPTDPLMDRFAFPRYRDTLSFYVAVEDHNSEQDAWHLYETDELFLPACGGLRKGALVKSGHWKYVDFVDELELGKKESNFLNAFCDVVANQHGKTADDVMNCLSVYNHWRQISTPIPIADLDKPLDIVFPDITVRSHRLLRFKKVNTARQLGELSQEQVMRIKSPSRNEILCLKERVDLSIKKEK